MNDMNEMVSRVDSIGEKEWFRSQMGMSKGQHTHIISSR